MEFIIITTINEPTAAISEFAELNNFSVVVVADLKTPKNWLLKHPNIKFFSIENQENFSFSLKDLLPYNHYSRKMLGYLYAIKEGASSIIDSDDDNFPSEKFIFPPMTGTFQSTENKIGWVNVYKYFTTEHIWPRGLPLNLIRSDFNNNLHEKESQVGIWQSLANGDSDVDAIYRLVIDKHIEFDSNKTIVLAEGAYAPFNSQSTKFAKHAFPLLYLPGTVTFRFTDILRGIVAQPILHIHNLKLGFISPIFYQNRNDHNYLQDFESEVPMYLNTTRALEIVKNAVSTKKSVTQNLVAAYSALAQNGIVELKELDILNAWVHDLHMIDVDE